jgi:hypothetical protein
MGSSKESKDLTVSELLDLLPLRRLKVAIFVIFLYLLIDNGPVADSGIQWPIPLIYKYMHLYLY